MDRDMIRIWIRAWTGGAGGRIKIRTGVYGDEGLNCTPAVPSGIGSAASIGRAPVATKPEILNPKP